MGFDNQEWSSSCAGDDDSSASFHLSSLSQSPPPSTCVIRHLPTILRGGSDHQKAGWSKSWTLVTFYQKSLLARRRTNVFAALFCSWKKRAKGGKEMSQYAIISGWFLFPAGGKESDFPSLCNTIPFLSGWSNIHNIYGPPTRWNFFLSPLLRGMDGWIDERRGRETWTSHACLRVQRAVSLNLRGRGKPPKNQLGSQLDQMTFFHPKKSPWQKKRFCVWGRQERFFMVTVIEEKLWFIPRWANKTLLINRGKKKNESVFWKIGTEGEEIILGRILRHLPLCVSPKGTGIYLGFLPPLLFSKHKGSVCGIMPQ